MLRRITAAVALALIVLSPAGCTRIVDKDTAACAEYRSVKQATDTAAVSGQEPPAAQRLSQAAEACTES